MAAGNLGIQSIHSIDIAVRQAEPWADFFTRGFGFQNIGVSTGDSVERTGTRRHLLQCGSVRITLAEAVHGGSDVRRFLDRHPDGIARLRLQVEDVAAVEARLIERHATLLDSIERSEIDGVLWRELTLATPVGDVDISFVDIENGAAPLLPGMEAVAMFDASANAATIAGIDHVAANVRTLMPVIAFYEHVLGLQRFWDVQFHTEDLRPGVGTGLKSIVMYDDASGLKLATNEPLRPRYHESQVAAALDGHRGAGLHHLAFAVDDIKTAVDILQASDFEMLPMPGAYYHDLPARLDKQGINNLPVSTDDLRERHILIDGDAQGYLLQAFCRNPLHRTSDHESGPLLFELIQRQGAKGFGEGNFRSLFEAMTKEG